jgi:hypothetical protein
MKIVDPVGFKKLMDEAEPDPANQPYYQECLQNDVVEMTRPMWEKGMWRWKVVDGKAKLYFPFDQMIEPRTPWRFVIHNADCFMWSDVLFEVVSMQIGRAFVPSFCHDCFKIVIAPRTLKELFALEALMFKLELPSKCGIEVRDYVPRIYGGYVYSRSVEEGRERFPIVRMAIDEDPDLGPDVPMILKRGCTEMEAKLGPSDTWVPPSKTQDRLEALIFDTIEWEELIVAQPPELVRNIHRRWIEWAFAQNDETYREYTGGYPIKGAPRTYHNQPEKEKEDG